MLVLPFLPPKVDSMESQQSVEWMEVPADADTPAASIMEELGLRNADQLEEIETVMNVYGSDTRLQLKRDRFHRIMLRCSISVNVCKSILHAVVTLIVPVNYPMPGCPLEVRITSRSGNKEFVSALTKSLTDEAVEFASVGAPAIMMLLGKAADNIQSMPKAMWSSDYCCCVVCNAKKVKNGEEKSPQPALKDDLGDWHCLVCGSSAVHISSICAFSEEEQDDHPCTMCFCGDICMVQLVCGDLVCFSCFVRLCEIAIGAKDLAPSVAEVIVPQKHGPRVPVNPLVRSFVGVRCPNHKLSTKAIISDPALIKLLPSRTYNRYNFFALEKSVTGIPCVVFCPLPSCCGYCFITDQPARFCMCPFCGDYFCAKCFQPYMGCQCKNVMSAEREIVLIEEKVVAAQMGLDFSSSIPPAKSDEPAPEKEPAAKKVALKEEQFVILVTVRNFQSSLCVPSGSWFTFLHHYFVHSNIVPYPSSHRYRDNRVFAAVFHGLVLDPSKSLKEQRVYSGGIVFLVEYFPCDAYVREGTISRLMEAQFSKVSGLVDVNKKKCPTCTKPVVHYLGHGCHMIYGCHPGLPEWCYVCGSVATGHRCTAKGCDLFCKFESSTSSEGKTIVKPINCDCPLCPECKPMRPCEQCCGCPMCQLVTR